MSAGRPRTFFHCHPEGEDPGVLLDPDQQVTEPWGEPEHGPCDKCEGKGIAAYECFSCIEAGTDPNCPACQGRVRFEQVCPTCQGIGEIHRTQRRGIAVFPSRAGLYRYLAWKNDAGIEGKVVVELGGGDQRRPRPRRRPRGAAGLPPGAGLGRASRRRWGARDPQPHRGRGVMNDDLKPGDRRRLATADRFGLVSPP